ncbi:MAG: AAA family ATPase [Candidatus Altiarchaeota archaeon]|nr:AAA family ATPase [Candidatus Altiarchaeota archaeon]
MALFDDMLKGDESLFKDEGSLDFDYLPVLLPYRESQQGYIAETIKPLVKGRQGKSLFIHGAPGIGKTSCVRFVFRELRETTDKVMPIYVNCWKKGTSNAVFTEIANQLGEVGVHYKTNEELLAKIEKGVGRYSGIVVAFDEIDKAKDYDFLYQTFENCKNLSMFLITNNSGFLANIDPRVRSRLILEEIKFEPYKRHETEGILRERMEMAFVPRIWGEEAFELIVEKAHNAGDIRIGLFLLRESGREAESAGSKKIKVEHAMKAIQKLVDFRINNLDELNGREKLVFSIIKEEQGIETGAILQRLKEKSIETPESTLRRMLQKLDKSGYIFREDATIGGKGKTMKHYVDE